jgi:hypothetical protein
VHQLTKQHLVLLAQQQPPAAAAATASPNHHPHATHGVLLPPSPLLLLPLLHVLLPTIMRLLCHVSTDEVLKAVALALGRPESAPQLQLQQLWRVLPAGRPVLLPVSASVQGAQQQQCYEQQEQGTRQQQPSSRRRMQQLHCLAAGSLTWQQGERRLDPAP